ncbi:MAG TPA: hypothetical protein ENI51_10770, partial [Candidatus Atribacteria bacterium]|nr:hypothetical protein [Candidatus Atribacteria bacterium]
MTSSANQRIQDRAIRHYKRLDPNLGMEIKLTKVQKYLREQHAIKANTETIESWIREYEKKIQKIQKIVSFRSKEEIKSKTEQFNITNLRIGN